MTIEIVREPRRGGCDFCGADSAGRVTFVDIKAEPPMVAGKIRCDACGAEARFMAVNDGKPETKMALANKLNAAWTEGRPIKILVARESTKGE